MSDLLVIISHSIKKLHKAHQNILMSASTVHSYKILWTSQPHLRVCVHQKTITEFLLRGINEVLSNLMTYHFVEQKRIFGCFSD